MSDEMNQQELRLAHLRSLREDGKDPFAAHSYERTHASRDVTSGFEELEGSEVGVCGRIMAKRGHGKSAFADVVDACGKIQIYAKMDELGEKQYEAFQEVDIGDIIGVRGEVFKTRSGEVTIRASEYTLLAKALRPLPEKWHGLQDVETRYRQRYLDLLMNEETREVFRRRAMIIQAARQFFYDRGFHEVETPILQDIYGGANARPFTTHHNSLDMDLYMRIAPELYLKRLVIGGLERVFEMGKVFRNEGIDSQHNPEFTILEAYQAYADYEQMMDLIEALVRYVAQEAIGSLSFRFGGNEIDLSGRWRRVALFEAVEQATGIDFAQIEGDEESRQACKSLQMDDMEDATYGELLDKAFERYVQPELIQPTFITDYPTVVSPLAKRSPADPSLAARFEPFIGGQECGNAFSELNDPFDQRARFEQQSAARDRDEEAHPMDEDFLLALEYGLPPTGGLGLGMDRIVMLLSDRSSIREVVLFPTLRQKSE